MHLVGCLYYYNTNYPEDNNHTFEAHYWTSMGDNTCKNFQYCHIVPNLGIIFNLISALTVNWGTQWRIWLTHCATSRKVAGLIPDGIIGIFHWYNLSGSTVALGLTQPLTEIFTRNFSWVVNAAGV